MPYRIALLVLLLASNLPAQTRPSPTTRGSRTHDPSTIVKCDDEYWGFSTGRGIRSYHSRDMENWEPGAQVFDRAPQWNAELVPGTRELNYWAPDVVRVGNKYLLYYSVSVFGKRTSAIGLATNATLNPADPKFKWSDEGAIVQTTGNEDYNAIDPSVMLDRDGKLWMAFGSFWSGIKLIELNRETGKRIAPDSPMHSLAHAKEIEAACIHRHGDDYFLVVNWGLCCRGVNSTYNIRVGRSATVTGPYLDKDGKDMLQGGGTLLIGSDGDFIGPGHAGIIQRDGQTYMSMHFYDGQRGGLATMAIRELTWDDKGWPTVSPAVSLK